MNYIELINNFWEMDEQWQFTCCETRLYFYLIKTANRLGWVDNWTHSDAKTAANVGVSENSLKTARNKLIQAGLVDFKAGGKCRGDKNRYQILIPKTPPNHNPNNDPNHNPNHNPNPTPLNKLNKTKLNNIPPESPNGGSSCGAKKKITVSSYGELEFIDERLMEHVRKWLEYKIEIKDPYKSEKSIPAFYNKLRELSSGNTETAKAIIDQSIANGWKGVFPLKTNETDGKPKNSNPSTRTTGSKGHREQYLADAEQAERRKMERITSRYGACSAVPEPDNDDGDIQAAEYAEILP